MVKKILSVGLFTFTFSLFTVSGSAQNYYTRQAGNWNDNVAVWSNVSQTAAPCSCTPSAALSGVSIVTIGNTILSDNGLASLAGTASLVINAGDSLTIRTSDLDISSGASIRVDGVLRLYGNLSMAGTTALTVSGTGQVIIFGNVNNSGSATVTNNGKFLVRGTVAKTSSAVFNGANQSFETGVVTGTMNVIH